MASTHRRPSVGETPSDIKALAYTTKNNDDAEANVVIDDEDYTPSTHLKKKLVRKFDLFMTPTLWFMCVLAYADQSNARAAGMATDLNLSDASKLHNFG
ncbi:hypothetical protein P154DRAFT_577148 [Amniculicola lignicola CBS 123094]|uniref:MFS general substrate transporter n=1 Tax=Amniculicola lignicola CBS 123094 TaxID=1392246 RepID=A0A6A5WGC5_9PLEO|nr:hypothetical protein P154DRAFT_577148 [Amniculicola lignicola CBS 123094]